MTSIFFNSSSNNHSPYLSDHYHEDHLNNHQFLNHNYQASSSSNSLTTHMFLDSNDQNSFFNTELQPPQHPHEGDNYRSQPYSDHEVDTNIQKEVEFSSWNKSEINNMIKSDLNQVKWMSSKMRVMLKMKKSEHVTQKEVTKFEDHKLPMEETYNSSNCTSSNNNIQIRVCSDCNTTKTPLWRSGPRGPKSLCNACGIRQRKARRALIAATATTQTGNGDVFVGQSTVRPLKVTKTLHKDHKIKGQVTKYKKRQYSKQITTTITRPPSPPSLSPSQSSSPARKNCVEEFLVRLSKNLTLYHVFPQDEKDAAILLMALSCGYAHGN